MNKSLQALNLSCKSQLKHISKNKQYPLCCPNGAPLSMIYELHKHCKENLSNSKYAPLALIMLYTSRSLSDVLDNLQVSTELPAHLCLNVTWKFPGKTSQDQAKDSHLYIELPTFLLPYLDADQLLNRKEYSEDEMLAFLKSSKKSLPYQFWTIAKVRKCLRQYVAFFDISVYEYSFIANEPVDLNAQLYYGHTDRQKIQLKLNEFIHAFEDNSLLQYPKDSDIQRNFNYEPVGSNFVIDTKLLIDELNKYITDIISSKRLNGFDAIRTRHNSLTIFIVYYLQLITAHRPSRRPFGKLTNFNLDSGLVLIKDKGSESERIRHLSSNAIRLMRLYIKLIEKTAHEFQFLARGLTDDLMAILSSQANAFLLINKKKRTDAPLRIPRNKLSSIANNFARHHSTSFLDNIGEDRDIIHDYLGHQSANNIDSPYNSLRKNSFKEFAEKIDANLINNGLNLQALWENL